MKQKKTILIIMSLLIIFTVWLYSSHHQLKNITSRHYLSLYLTINTQVEEINGDLKEINFEEVAEYNDLSQTLGKIQGLRLVSVHLPPPLDGLYSSLLKLAQDDLNFIITENEDPIIKLERWEKLQSTLGILEEISEIVNPQERYETEKYQRFLKDIHPNSPVGERIEEIHMNYINSLY